ncbi:MAG: YbaK/EbsC family protein [Terriglobia bacterium]
MKLASRLLDYLDQNKVWYVRMSHPRAYTAQEIAAVQHIPGSEMAKTIILKADEDFVMMVVPATKRIAIETLKEKLPYREITFATEYEFAWLFPDSEVGAMPPFGNLYDLTVYVDKSLSTHKEIVFNAGTHAETIRMLYKDFEALVRPKIIDLFSSRHNVLPKAG